MKPATPFSASRRLVLGLPSLLLGCAGTPAPPRAAKAPGELELQVWRTVGGGFLATPSPLTGAPARPGAGPYVKLLAPTAVALLDDELLIADSGTRRVWRADLGMNTLVALPGVMATPATLLALAPDRSAWVLDGVGGQVRRFSRDGRLLQSVVLGPDAAAPVGLALVDAGATLLVADSGLRRWLEFRAVGAFADSVRLRGGDDRVQGVDAVASAGEAVWVLDRTTALVHRVDRSGSVQLSLGAGALKQPVALAVDRSGRVWVLDAQDQRVKLLREGRPVQVFDAAALRVQQPAAIAASGRFLAVADRLGAQVVVHQVLEGRP